MPKLSLNDVDQLTDYMPPWVHVLAQCTRAALELQTAQQEAAQIRAEFAKTSNPALLNQIIVHDTRELRCRAALRAALKDVVI